MSKYHSHPSFRMLFLICLSLVFITFEYGYSKTINEDITMDNLRIEDISTQQWKVLQNKVIFFGHQSVGYNIVDGIGEITKNNSAIDLSIVEITSSYELSSPVFEHSGIGSNCDPLSKNAAFEKSIDRLYGPKKLILRFLSFVSLIFS